MYMMSVVRALCLVIVLVLGVLQIRAAGATLSLTSPAFRPGGTLPHHFEYRGYGCEGDDVSPPLHWTGAPAGARAYALTIFDPDANRGKGWWHWVVFDIPEGAHGLVENAGAAGDKNLPPHAMHGLTSFGSAAYGGPCPPVGDPPHHYVFTLYALDLATLPDAKPTTTGPQLEELLKGHVLAKTELVGRFGRP